MTDGKWMNGLGVNVWCTAAFGCQPNCGYIYTYTVYIYSALLTQFKIIRVHPTVYVNKIVWIK
jgi:hypothetical protein